MKLAELQQLIASVIAGSEFEKCSYFAGGSVRDWLIDPETKLKEADLCIELKQGGILLAEKLCKELKGSGLVRHPAFGTAGFSYRDVKLEFVATRKEVYRQGNRFPRVSFGSLGEDVFRRDFTINALLMQVSSSEVIDLTGLGMADLKAGLIRCVGDPVLRFTEDPLRIVRAWRFSLKLGFGLEAKTQRALELCGKLLSSLSQRAINNELTKLEPVLRDELRKLLISYTDLTD